MDFLTCSRAIYFSEYRVESCSRLYINSVTGKPDVSCTWISQQNNERLVKKLGIQTGTLNSGAMAFLSTTTLSAGSYAAPP